MSLTVVEKTAKNSDFGNLCFLNGHCNEVLSIVPDGDVFASCDASGLGLLWVWESTAACEPRHVGKISTGGPAIMDASFVRHTRLCTAQGDGTVGVWDLETGRHEHALSRVSSSRRPNNWPVINTVTSLKNGSVVYGGDEGFLIFNDLSQKDPVAVLNLKTPITSLTSISDSVFVGDALGRVRCVDIRTLKTVYSLCCHRDAVSCVELNDNASRMVSYGMDNLLALWDVQPFALNKSDRLLYRVEMQQGDSRNLLRCSWSKSHGVLVPTGDGQIVRLNTSMMEGESRTVLPIRHQNNPANCAVCLGEKAVVSCAGSEVILQRL